MSLFQPYPRPLQLGNFRNRKKSLGRCLVAKERGDDLEDETVVVGVLLLFVHSQRV